MEEEELTVTVGHAVELLWAVCLAGTLIVHLVHLAFLNYPVVRID